MINLPRLITRGAKGKGMRGGVLRALEAGATKTPFGQKKAANRAKNKAARASRKKNR